MTLAQTFTVVRNAFFGVLTLVNKQTSMSRYIFHVLTTVNFVQIINFSFVTAARSDVGDSAVLALLARFSALLAQLNVFESSKAFLVIFAVSCLWTTAFLWMLLMVGWRWAHQSPQNVIMLKVLRGTALLSSTTLFLPFTSQLLKTYACVDGQEWNATGVQCWGALHMVLIVWVSVLLPVFTCVSVVVAAVIVNRSLVSSDVSTRSHGRQQTLMLAWKVVLALAFTVGGGSLNRWLALVLLLGAAASWLGCAVYFMAWHHLSMVQFDVGMATANAMVVLSVLLALLQPESSSTRDTGFVAITGAILGYLAGSAMINKRMRNIVARPISSLNTMPEISLWARYRVQLHAMAEQEQQRHAALQGAMVKEPVKAAPATEVDDSVSVALTDAPDPPESSTASAIQSKLGRSAKVAPLPSNTSALLQMHAQDPAAYLLASNAMRHGLHQLIDDAEMGFKLGMEKFAENGQAFVEAANFFQAYHKSRFMELQTLSVAARVDNALDVTFVVYQRLRGMQEGTSERAHGRMLSAIDRVQYDQQVDELKRLEVDTKRAITGLWEELARHTVDLSKVERIAETLRSSTARVEALYQGCLKMNPDSVALVRAHADYLANVRNDPMSASELYAKALRLEDTQQRMKVHKVQHVSMMAYHYTEEHLAMMDEQNASISISASPRDLGTITMANAAAARLFGRPVQAFLGSNVNMIVPHPFKDAHDGFLLRYLRNTSRQSSSIVGKTRVVVTQDVTGYLFPLRMQVQEAPPTLDGDASLQITAIMQRVETDEGIVLFSGAEQGFVITGVCRKTATALCLDLDDVGKGLLSAAQFFPDLLGYADGTGSAVALPKGMKLEFMGSGATSGCPVMHERAPETPRSARGFASGTPGHMNQPDTLLDARRPVQTRMLVREDASAEPEASSSDNSAEASSVGSLSADLDLAETAEASPLLPTRSPAVVSDAGDYATVLAAVEHLRIRSMPTSYLLTWTLPKVQHSASHTSRSKRKDGKRGAGSTPQQPSRVSFVMDRQDTSSSAALLAKRLSSLAGPARPTAEPGPDPPSVRATSTSAAAEHVSESLLYLHGEGHEEMDEHLRDDQSAYSKSSSGVTSQHKLLRRLVESVVRDTRLPPAAIRLKWVLFSIVLFFLVSTVTSFAVLTTSSLSGVQEFSLLAWQSMTRMQLLALFMTAVGRARATVDAVAGPTFNQSVTSMLHHWTAFRTAHQQLLSLGQNVGGEQLLWDLTAGRFQLYDPEWGTYQNRSLFELSAYTESSMEAIATLPNAASVTPSASPELNFMLTNMFPVLFPAMNASALMKQTELSTYLTDTVVVEMTVVASILAVCTLANVLIAATSLRHLEREKKAVARMLLFIPKWGAQILHNRSQRMYQAALRAAQSDAAGIDSDSEEDQTTTMMTDEELMSMWMAKESVASNTTKKALDSGGQGGSSEMQDTYAVSYSTEVRMTTKPPRPFHTNSNFIWRSVLKLILPMPIMLVWAIAVWLLHYSMQDVVGDYVRRSYLSSQVATVSMNSYLKLSSFQMHQHWADRGQHYSDVIAMDVYINEQLRTLVHGADDFLGKELAALPQDSQAFSLLADSVCASSGDDAACAAWMSGVNLQGIAGWTTRYLSAARRLAAIAKASTAQNFTQAAAADPAVRSLQSELGYMLRYVYDSSLSDAAMDRVQAFFLAEIESSVTNTLSYLRTATIVSNVLMTLMFFMFWRPTADVLGSSLSSTRILMAVTPQVAISRVPAVAALIKQLGASRQGIIS